jgi:nucleotide-binding universal stress UspA family protein
MKGLVTLDGSKLSEAALEPALKIADALNAEVHLLRVSERAPRGTIGSERDPGLIRGAEIGVVQPTLLADALAPHSPTGESEREEVARRVAEQAEQELR